MDANDIKMFYDAVQAVGKDKIDRLEFEARQSIFDARVTRLELENDDRYKTILNMISSLKDDLAKRDQSKLMVIFASVLSFIGGGGLLSLLVASHIIHG